MSSVNNEVMESYLPAQSRVLVTLQNGNHIWYTTKKEIVCTDPQECQCPRTDTPVHRVIYKDEKSTFTVYYRPSQACTRIKGMVEVDENRAKNLALSFLYYDIPTNSGITSPCGRLRRIAVRVNLSCWIIPTDSIPYSFLDSLTEAGANWNVAKFDPSEGRKLVQQALNSLKAEVEEATQRATQAQQDAERILTSENQTVAQREKAYLLRSKQIKKRMDDLEKDLTEASTCFGINPLSLRLSVARNASEAIQAGMRQRCRMFAHAARQAINSDHSTLQTLGTLAQNDRVPANILADAHMDFGNGETGEALAQAFNENPQVENDELVVVPAGEEDEFRLGVD